MENKEDTKRHSNASEEETELLGADEASKRLLEYSMYADIHKIKRLLDMGADVNVKNHRDRTPLHLASIRGDEPLVACFLDRNADTMAEDCEKMTALHLACEKGYANVVRTLLMYVRKATSGGSVKEYVNLQDMNGNATLHHASKAGSLPLVQRLRRFGAKLDMLNNVKQTPLCVACLHGHISVCEYFLKKDTSLNSESRPLHCAVKSGKIDILKLLLNRGVGINTEDVNGKTPLHISCEKGNVEVTRFLLEKKANVHVSKPETPLHSAVTRKGNIEIVKLLIAKGVNIEAHNVFNETALYKCCSTGDMDVLEFLLQKGARINTVKNPIFPAIKGEYCGIVKRLIQQSANVNATDGSSNSALHFACKGCTKNAYEIVKILVENKASVNAKSNTYGAPLNIAASKTDSRDMVEILLENEANLESRSTENMTPLFQAVCYSDLEVIELLLRKGANVNARSNCGQTPLHRAIDRNRLDVVQLLIQYQADIEARTSFGKTALHQACQFTNIEIVQFLLSRGAFVNASDTHGATPLYTACLVGDSHIIRLLVASGAEANEPIHTLEHSNAN